MDARTPADLVTTWRAEALVLRRRGAPALAEALESCADELEQVASHAGSELLSLAEAALISGYTTDHLGRLLREGKLTNHGRPHAPRIRRAELPTKASALRSGRSGPMLVGATPRQVAAAVVTSREA